MTTIGANPMILVVEDEPLLRMVVEDMLADNGFEVVPVITGDQAIEELDQDAARFSAVLTDIRMPGKATGWSVAQRARDLHQDIPVVYMTGDSAFNWKVNAVPGSILLQKPFTDAQLLAALADLMKQRGT